MCSIASGLFTDLVVILLVPVKLKMEGKNVDIEVTRLEVYHKKQGKRCNLAGQGTQVDENLSPINCTGKLK